MSDDTTTCLCGQHVGLNVVGDDDEDDENLESNSVVSSLQIIKPTPIDASFIHLPPPIHVTNQTRNDNWKGFLGAYQHLQVLQSVTLASDTDELPCLCRACVSRVTHAIDTEAKSLDDDSEFLNNLVLEEETRISTLKRALRIDSDDDANNENAMENLQDKMLNEIAMLEQAIEQQEQEILQLHNIMQSQLQQEKELDEFESLIHSEQNDLLVESNAFMHDQRTLSSLLVQAQDEVDRLTSTDIKFPALMFDLQVDKERGLRYPLINDLRLAYRPKGDLQWSEISAAWSLAAQLLLVIGTTFGFQSQQWKIIPLSNCSKLIFYESSNAATSGTDAKPIVINLGHSKEKKSMLAWNGLLYTMVCHVEACIRDLVQRGILATTDARSKSASAVVPQPPYQMTSTSIFGISLSSLREDDDSSWSRVVQFLSCNLAWLSDCASVYCLQRVTIQSAV